MFLEVDSATESAIDSVKTGRVGLAAGLVVEMKPDATIEKNHVDISTVFTKLLIVSVNGVVCICITIMAWTRKQPQVRRKEEDPYE